MAATTTTTTTAAAALVSSTFIIATVCSALLLVNLLPHAVGVVHATPIACDALFPSMYCCVEPRIDAVTQQPTSCRQNNTYPQQCFLRRGVKCSNMTGEPAFVDKTSRTYLVAADADDANAGPGDIVNCGGDHFNTSSSPHFIKESTCSFVDSGAVHDFETAVSLSVFFGMFGFDRFYLGYYGLGLAKFCTLGGFFIWQLADIVMISLQVVEPADGTAYRIVYNGPRMVRTLPNSDTFYPPLS